MCSSQPPANSVTLHDTDAQCEFPQRHQRVKVFAVTQHKINSTFCMTPSSEAQLWVFALREFGDSTFNNVPWVQRTFRVKVRRCLWNPAFWLVYSVIPSSPHHVVALGHLCFLLQQAPAASTAPLLFSQPLYCTIIFQPLSRPVECVHPCPVCVATQWSAHGGCRTPTWKWVWEVLYSSLWCNSLPWCSGCMRPGPLACPLYCGLPDWHSDAKRL